MNIKDLRIIDKSDLTDIETDLGYLLKHVEYRVKNHSLGVSDNDLFRGLRDLAVKIEKLC